MKIKIFVAHEIQCFEIGIFSFNSYVYYLARGFIASTSCIDLFITNCSKYFQDSNIVQTGTSDFHEIVVTVMKTTYQKLEPETISDRGYEYYFNERFRERDIYIH